MKVSDNFLRFYLPVILYMTAIFVFSCFHNVPLPQSDRLSTDKIYHGLEYSVLGFLLLRLFNLRAGQIKWGILVILSYLAGTSYGVGDEIHQLFVPGRFFSYWDIAADSAGILLGCWVFKKFGGKIERMLSRLK